MSHCPQLSHMASHGAGGLDSDTREATLWFSEARSERYAHDPSLGWLVLCLAALTL